MTCLYAALQSTDDCEDKERHAGPFREGLQQAADKGAELAVWHH